MYTIDSRAPKGRDRDAVRVQLRTTESRCVLGRIRAWSVQVSCTPEKAIQYMSNRWSKAARFLDEARLPLDNNAAERALRGLVLGRKKHYGSKSRRGTEVAAVFYALIESAKLAGVEPAAYLMRAAQSALVGGEPPLPHELVRA